MITRPEVLAPAGDMECLNSALSFGADAVFLAGKMFGMRSASKNFDNTQLKQACELAHAKGAKLYVTCNTLPRNNELDFLPDYLSYAQECGVDAFIIADLGVFEAAKKYAPKVARHISTQAGVTNYATANVLYNMGASRVVLAREIPLDEIAQMRAKIPKDLEIECFVHGAMCVSFSGRCLISSYMTGRDANHGDCAQPCRWKYHLFEENREGQYFPVEEHSDGTYLYNSRDLCMIEHIPELVKAGVSSLKIEGRAKSAYYVALTVNAYRAALDSCLKGEKPPKWVLDEVNKISHRPYSTGFFYGKPTDGSGTQDPNIVTNGGQYFADSGYMRDYDFVGVVDYCEDGVMHLTQRNYFTLSDELELLPPHAEPIIFKPESMFGADGTQIDIARRATEKLSIPTAIVVPPHTILRKKMN